MWHGSYMAWLEEARVEALRQAGLAYSDLSERGLEMPVISLKVDYRKALLHGESVRVESWVLAQKGVKLPWRSTFLKADGSVAAEAHVELVLVELSQGPSQRRLLRRPPEDLRQALEQLREGPSHDTIVAPLDGCLSGIEPT